MHTVRTHNRATASGGTATVRQHSASGGSARPRLTVARTHSGRVLATGLTALIPPRRPKNRRRSLARRGWGNIKRSWKAAGRDKWALAAGYSGLATAQLAGFVTLRGVAYAALAAGVLAVGLGLAARGAANGRKAVA